MHQCITVITHTVQGGRGTLVVVQAHHHPCSCLSSATGRSRTSRSDSATVAGWLHACPSSLLALHARTTVRAFGRSWSLTHSV